MSGACEWIHARGALLRVSEAAILATDRGFLFGDAVYTVLKVRDSLPLFIDRHLARLEQYLCRIGLPPLDDLHKRASQTIGAVIGANELVEGRVRITVSRHAAHGHAETRDGISLVVVAYPAQPATSSLDAVTRPDGRDKFRDIKSVNRLVATMALRSAHGEGAQEAIFTVADRLIEGTCHNLFAWDGHRLTTPDLEGRGVAGVVRELLMEHLPVTVAEQPASGSAALYLTNSITGVAAIHRLDGRKLPRDDAMYARLRATLDLLEEDDTQTQQKLARGHRVDPDA